MARGSDVTVRWGVLDSALAVVAPTAAAKRYAARASIANLRRSYEGGSKSLRSDAWRTSGTAADSEIAAAGAALRERMRDLVRNNALAAQAVQVLVNNMVGPGIRPRARTGVPETDKRINELFEAWSKRCDAHGHTDFYGLQALAVREMIEGGDVFAVKRPRRSRQTLEVPLEIELREADHLDTSRVEDVAGQSRIRQGIQYDASGRRSAYWMFPDHPGDMTPTFGRRDVSVPVPAKMVAHLFERQRVQSRGVPWGTPAIMGLRDLGDWQVAEMARKKAEACLVGIVFSEDSEGVNGVSASPDVKVEDAQGNLVEQFSPGMLAYARGGKDIKFNTPGSSAGIREWNTTQMHIIAAGFRVPYALMTGDLREANFSSSRVGINEFRRMIDQVQWQVIIPMFCEKIWAWFCDAAFTAGLLDSPDIPVEWAPPAFESVNPWQDAQTDLLEVRAGFSTLPQKIAQRGYDARAVLQEQADTLKVVDELELVLTSDPRRMTNVGQAQTTDPLDPPNNADGNATGDTPADKTPPDDGK